MNTNELISAAMLVGLILVPTAMIAYSVATVMDVLRRRKDKQQQILDKAEEDGKTS